MLKKWNELSEDERLLCHVILKRLDKGLVSIIKDNEKMPQRLKDYYLNAVSKLKDTKFAPFMGDCDEKKNNKMLLYNAETRRVQCGAQRILTTLTHMYKIDRIKKIMPSYGLD